MQESAPRPVITLNPDAKYQCKSTVNNNIAQPEPSYLMTARPEQSNPAETQENNLKMTS